MKVRFYLLSLIFICKFSIAQPNTVSPLTLGDHVPNIELELYTEDSFSVTHLNEYKGKLVLFDFWGVDCPDCIAGMPHMLELQKKFKNKIQVILVTQDNLTDIKKLWVELKKHTSNAETLIDAARHLPFITSDSIVWKIFPHIGNPIHVWVDTNMIYRALTYPPTTTINNIDGFLKGKKVDLAWERLVDLDYQNPISWLHLDGSYRTPPPYYSFFLNRIEMGPGSGHIETDIDSASSKTVALRIVNKTILELYKLAYFKNVWEPDERILIEAKNPKIFYPPNYDEYYYKWADENIYCYALRVLPSSSIDVYSHLREDLDKFFGLESKIEARKVECLVLKRSSRQDKIISNESIQANEITIKPNGLTLVLHKQPMNSLVERINSIVKIRNRFMPFLDETHYSNMIDVELPWKDDWNEINIDEIQKALEKYGLEMVKTTKILNVLVLRSN